MPPNQPLTADEVRSPQLVEPENPNDAVARNPGDPTVSWNADGSLANQPHVLAATVPVNPAPDATQSDPAHVPSPYQDPAAEEAQKESARLREEALQSENRFVPERRAPLHEQAEPEPVRDRLEPEPLHEQVAN
jgi:hypothetical protein